MHGGSALLALLDTLSQHGVEFLIVGGLSAVIQGVPVTTLDVDVVHRRTPENVERLLEALEALSAASRLDARGLRPSSSHLLSPGHELLKTRYGLLDLLGELSGGLDYEALYARCDEVELAGMKLRVLRLEALLEIKRATGRPKDQLVIPLIEHTLAERDRRKP